MRDLDNGGSEDGRNAGIDGIAAGGEQLGAGVDRERSAGSDHPVRRADLAAHLPRRRRRWLLREHDGTAQDDRRGCAEKQHAKESQVNPIGNFAHRKRQTPRRASSNRR